MYYLDPFTYVVQALFTQTVWGVLRPLLLPFLI